MQGHTAGVNMAGGNEVFGKAIPMSEASDLLKQRLPSGRGRRLDHEFLSRIAKQVTVLGSSDIIYPAS